MKTSLYTLVMPAVTTLPQFCPSPPLLIPTSVHPHLCSSPHLLIPTSVHPQLRPSPLLSIPTSVHLCLCKSSPMSTPASVHPHICPSVLCAAINLLGCCSKTLCWPIRDLYGLSLTCPFKSLRVNLQNGQPQ